MGPIEFPTTVRKGGLQRPLSVFTPKILRTQIGGVQSISAIQLLPGRHRHPGLERWQTWSPGSSPVQDLNITIKTSQTNILQVSSPPYYTKLLSHRNSSFLDPGHIFLKKWSKPGCLASVGQKTSHPEEYYLWFQNSMLPLQNWNQWDLYIVVNIFNLREGVGPSAEYMPISQPNPRDLDWNLF